MPEVFKNFINGEWVPSKTGATFNDINPADKSDIVGVFQNLAQRILIWLLRQQPLHLTNGERRLRR